MSLLSELQADSTLSAGRPEAGSMKLREVRFCEALCKGKSLLLINICNRQAPVYSAVCWPQNWASRIQDFI